MHKSDAHLTVTQQRALHQPVLPGRVAIKVQRSHPVTTYWLAFGVGTQSHAKLMIANRGEISRRVIRSAQSLGIPTVVVFTEPDALSLHVKDGDEAVCLGASPKEYTNAAKLLEVMKSTK